MAKKANKTVSKKSTAKITPAKPKQMTASKKKAVVSKAPKLLPPKTPYKKTELFGTLTEQTELSKKDVQKVLEALQTVMKLHLVKNGPGQFVLPGLFKMTVVTKPATKARKGTNPFTGEEMMFKAKPARRVVKVRVLKKFKAEIE